MLAAVYLLSGLGLNVHAQMTIGADRAPVAGAVLDLSPVSGYIGGLKLPHVEIEDLEFIPASFTEIATAQDVNDDLTGILVYNTRMDLSKTITPGVYVWDGNRWKISDCCSGGGSQNWGGNTDLQTVPSVASGKDGGGKDNSCTTTENYQIELIAGNAYATLSDLNPATGRFKINFQANTTTSTRPATVRVTSPCGTSFDYEFEQDARASWTGTDPQTIPSPGGDKTGGGRDTNCTLNDGYTFAVTSGNT